MKHSHYFKKVPYEYVDVYRVLELFDVTNPSIAHAVKKLLVAGNRGHKDLEKDVQEAIDSLVRWQQMREEDREAEEELVRRANVSLDKIDVCLKEIVAYAKSPEKSSLEDTRKIVQQQTDMYMGLAEDVPDNNHFSKLESAINDYNKNISDCMYDSYNENAQKQTDIYDDIFKLEPVDKTDDIAIRGQE